MYKSITCKTALNHLSSNYLPYEWDLNIYRGCQHHCQYCYALYSHNYLNSGDFFGTIYVKENIVEVLCHNKPDIAVLALHGKYGEDGCIQGVLETLQIPYTGSGVLGSSVGMDKAVCRMVAQNLNINIPDGAYYHINDSVDDFISNLNLNYPVIVKPSREGSTINVTIVHKESEMNDAIKIALKSDSKVIVEEYIKGKEITVGVINNVALTPLEVVPKSGFYDYESKYTKGKTDYIVPARIDELVSKQVKNDSLKIYNAIEASGIARVDFIVSENNNIYMLEINTMPGMTELSLVPKAAKYDGMEFNDVVEELLKSATLKEY